MEQYDLESRASVVNCSDILFGSFVLLNWKLNTFPNLGLAIHEGLRWLGNFFTWKVIKYNKKIMEEMCFWEMILVIAIVNFEHRKKT